MNKTYDFSQNLTDLWDNSEIAEKRKLQYMVFPEGIEYDYTNGNYRTLRVNSFFELTRSLSNSFKEIKNGNSQHNEESSRLVHPEGVEPSTPGAEIQCSIQLSYGCIFKGY